MSVPSLSFSNEEQQKLKAFFEQLHIDFREFSDDTFECTEEGSFVFSCKWNGSTWGYHDESWYDIAEFTISKTPFAMPEIDLENTINDKRMSGRVSCIVENSNVCRIVELNCEGNDYRYRKLNAVLVAESFLDISERVRIACCFCRGEW